jgi:hypothetical protein
MWDKIDQVVLENGRIMEVRRVMAPDRYHESHIKSLLPKYSALWMWHLNLALSGRLDDLETRFYVGVLDGKLIGNVSTWECGPIGILGHLFTAKRHREKGVCTTLTKIMFQDLSSRGGKILIGGFKPASRRIARKLGFKSLTEKSEVMYLELNRCFEQNYFHADKLWCRDLKWRDWPGVSLLFGVKEGWCMRSMKHKIFGPYDYEDCFLEDMWGMQQGLCQPKVLAAENGNVIGYAALTLKDSRRRSFWLLDFFIHPAKVSDVDILLDALTFPPGKTRCHIERDFCEKFDALLDRGFAEKTRRRFKFRGKTLDIIMMVRS